MNNRRLCFLFVVAAERVGKGIRARTYFNDRCLLLLAHLDDPFRGFHCLAAFCHLASLCTWEEDGCGGVRRYRDGERECSIPYLPTRSDLAIEGVVARGGSGETATGTRSEANVLVARGARFNPRHDLIEPASHGPFGIMVQRPFGGTILPYPIPVLPDGGGSLFDLVEPGGNSVLLEQGIRDIQLAVRTQDVTEERGGQKSRAQMIVVFLNQHDQVVYCGSLQCRGHQVKCQGADIGGLLVRVYPTILVDEHGTIGLLDPPMERLVFPRVVVLAQDVRDLGQ